MTNYVYDRAITTFHRLLFPNKIVMMLIVVHITHGIKIASRNGLFGRLTIIRYGEIRATEQHRFPIELMNPSIHMV